jgi:glutathione synthase/RimK-type ligase-like ATP-grasp enzyme
MLNKNAGRAKLSAIRDAEKDGIKVPESKLSLSPKDNPKLWIEKRQNSIGGLGIKLASKNRRRIHGKYFQRFVNDRKYEIRVHAFSWTDNWSVQKRHGSQDEIAWNFRNGGTFSTVHNPNSGKVFIDAIEISKRILEIRHMSFGAVDFIVDNDLNVYFIEINSAPGFKELSAHIYIDAFNVLKGMSSKELKKYI